MSRFLLGGFLIGFAIAASPGPISLLCVRRTLSRGWLNGLASGLGVATADATYGALAAFGVATVTTVLIAERRWLALLGGVAIAAIGLRTLLARPAVQAHAEVRGSGSLGFAYISMVGLTIANPGTILGFAAIFAGLGLSLAGGPASAVAVVAGVLAGSASWWLILTGASALLRGRIDSRVNRVIGIVSGVALIGFGVVAALGAVRPG